MKRYRHYNKKRAIVLACFGSVIEQKKYLDLKEIIKEKFSHCDVFISFSSRMVIKILKKEKKEDYKNLAQTLSDVDMLGYKHVVISSINIYPTDEHEFLKKIVDGFKHFSLANLAFTNALLTKTKETSDFLKDLNDKVSQKDTANLYVIHGTPKLNTLGIDSITYTSSFLEAISETNFTCSLEGAMPYDQVGTSLKLRMKKAGVKKVQVIPMLLVSGNHYMKDMHEIKDDLSDMFDSSITKSLSKGSEFNLIELEKTQSIIVQEIEDSFTMMGIQHKQFTY